MRIVFLLSLLLTFLTAAHAAITTLPAPIYVTATKTLQLSAVVSGGVGTYTFSIVSGGGSIANGIFTAPDVTGVTKIRVRDSSTPTPQTAEFDLTMMPMSLRVSSIVIGPGKTRDIIIDGGIPPFRLTSSSASASFVEVAYYKFTYTAPTTPGNYTITVADKSVSKTIAVEVVPEFKVTQSILDMAARSSFNYTTKLTGGKAPYSCAVSGSIITLCNGSTVSVGTTTGQGTITITDDSKQTATFTVKLSAMSLSKRSLLVAPGETQSIAIYGGVPVFVTNKAEAVVSGSQINYTAPQIPVSFSVSDSATNNGTVGVEVVRKLAAQTLNVGINTTQVLSVVGGKAPLTFTKISGVGTVTSTGSFNSTTAGTATITVKDSYSPQQTATLTVNVGSPPTATFSASSLSILPGSTTTLSWTQTGATSVKINGTAVSGSSMVVSPTVTTKYTLVASNTLGSVTKEVTISVASEISRTGTFIAEEYAPNCVPSEKGDYFEKALGHQERIEPKDCEIINVSRPSFVWRPKTNAIYKLIISKTGMTPITIEKTYPRHLMTSSLQDGLYNWKVEYWVGGSLVDTSALRYFAIKNTATAPIPTPQEFSGRVAFRAARPRSIAYGSSLAAILNKIPASDLAPAYNAYLAKALDLSNDTIPSLTGQTESAIKQYSMDERKVIEYLGFAYHFTGKSNADYLNGVKRIVTLASIDPRGVTSEAITDQANREIILALAIGLDLYNDKITGTDRTTVVNSIKDRMAQLTPVIKALDNEPYMSHTLSSVHYVTEALMYLVGLPEFPNAKTDLEKMYETYMTIAGTWGGQDGGYANGSSYSWYTLGTVVRSLAAIKLVTGFNIHEYAPLGNVGLNNISQYVPGVNSRGHFGDEVENIFHYENYAHNSFRMLAQVTKREDYEWYWRVGATTKKLNFDAHPFHYLLLGSYSTLPTAPAAPVVPNTFLFEDAGFAAIHNNAKASDRSSVFFRSSRFGAFNHSHGDNNAFTLVSKGKDILISAGYFSKYMEGHHAFVQRATKFKNALTFDKGIGQAEALPYPIGPTAPIGRYRDVSGKMVNFMEKGNWTIITGDATKSYQGFEQESFTWKPFLTGAYRSIAYNRSTGLILIYDYASSDTNRMWELNFHSLVAANPYYSNGMKIVNGAGSACLDVIAPAGAMTYTSAFPNRLYAEDLVKYPDQHHYTYAVTNSSKEFVSLTIIREGCSSPGVPNRVQTGSSYKVSTPDGKIIVFDKKGFKFYE